MNSPLSHSLLTEFSGFLTEQVGISFPESNWDQLRRGIHAIADQSGLGDAHLVHQYLGGGELTAEQVEALAAHLTVGETYFFREPRTLETLENRILPGLIRTRREGDRRLRFWSAGCCTGEEPYTIAILLSRLIPDLRDWDVTILATDINRAFLARAARGEFSKWSFRGAPDWLQGQCFTQTSHNGFQILPHLREMVSFSYLNLARDNYPSLLNNTTGMDVISSRNVLMYFAPESAARVVRRLSCSLVEGGWLIVSPTETSIVDDPSCPTVSFPGAILHQKRAVTAPWPEIPAAAIRTLPPVAPVAPAGALAAHSRSPSENADGWLAAQDQARDGQPPAAPAPLPDSAPYEEALALYEGGQYGEAASRLAPLIESPPPDGDGVDAQRRAMLLLARSCANQGLLADALAWCERAVTDHSLDPEVRYLRSTVLQELGRSDEAVVDLRRTLYLDPRFVLAHFTLGNLGLGQGEPDAARRHFQNALELLPAYGVDEPLPQADGITAGRLREIITAIADLGDDDDGPARQ